MRMKMRGFTRLTNAFQKKLDNHRWAIRALFYALQFLSECTKLFASHLQWKQNRIWSIKEVVSVEREKSRMNWDEIEGGGPFFPSLSAIPSTRVWVRLQRGEK